MRHPPATVRTRLAAGLTGAALVAGLALTTPAAAADPQPASTLDPFDAVDMWIGTGEDFSQNKGNAAYGNTWPGATVPFGMVQSSPTTYRSSDGDARGGYEYSADKLRGFGMNRLSGTGCVNRNGAFDFPLVPYTGTLTEDGALPVSPGSDIGRYYLPFDHQDENAEPGYYSVHLKDDTRVGLTATTRTAISEFAFPSGSGSTLLFNTSGSNNRVFGGEVEIDEENSTVSGWVETAAVCDEGGRYRAYYSASFDQPIVSSGTWEGSQTNPGGTEATAQGRNGAGAFITFPQGSKVTVKAGLSYVSIENAAENAAAEAAPVTFGEARADAADLWRSALGTVDAAGGTDAERTKLYTALYHSLLHPNVYEDVNGEYFGYDGQVRQVEPGRHHYATYSGWDMYRGQAQLVALLFPEVASDINQSLTELATQTGHWPNWPHNGVPQQKMSGDALLTVLASIDSFGATDYDRQAALDAMTESLALPVDPARTKRVNGFQYAALGFIENSKGSVATSTALEYAVNDFSVAQLADALGDQGTYDHFMQRAQNWRNLVDPERQEIRPRGRNGFDRNFNLGERGNQFDQATGYQYNWAVPHNMAALIELRGGEEKVAAELDHHLTHLDAGVYNTPYAYMSNQPSTSTPWAYNWLRQPAKTGEVLDRARDELYTTAPTGLPGNDDLGSLSSWYVWSNLGIYPGVFGRAELLVSAPAFESVTITSAGTGTDRVISIEAPGAADQRYIGTMAVNGTPSTASWLPESFAVEGGTLELTMADEPSDWGTGADDVPPSFDAGTDVYNNIGTTLDGQGNTGSIDASDNSLSRQQLAAAGASPGAELALPDTGITYTWPDAEPGAPDNWIPHGQRVEMGVRAGELSFLGLATNGPATGTATVVYEDGTTQEVPVELTDWTPGTNYRFGNVPVVTTEGRNRANGTQDTTVAKVFGTAPVAVDPAKVIDAVILPSGSDRGVMHLFAIGTSPAGEVPDGPEISATAELRCVAGNLTLAVRAVNEDGGPLDIELATPYGTTTVTGVQPGAAAYQSFRVRQQVTEPGTATITARPSGASDGSETVLEVEFAPHSCG